MSSSHGMPAIREEMSAVGGMLGQFPHGGLLLKGSTMTDPNYTALLLVIDRSGSMEGIRDDMVGGLSAMLAAQAAEPGLLTVDVVTFDTEIDFPHTMARPADVTIALEPRGGTALFDAIGMAVTRFGHTLAELAEDARPDTVQVVVVTDGEENSSNEYSLSEVRSLVTQQKVKYSWDFVFLGANQDAVLAGERLGFDADSSMTFAPGAAGVSMMTESVGRYVKDVRGNQKRGFDVGERVGSMMPDVAPAAVIAPKRVRKSASRSTEAATPTAAPARKRATPRKPKA